MSESGAAAVEVDRAHALVAVDVADSNEAVDGQAAAGVDVEFGVGGDVVVGSTDIQPTRRDLGVVPDIDHAAVAAVGYI